MNHTEYLAELTHFREPLDKTGKSRLETVIRNQTKSPVVSFGYSYFLGYFGVDRFRLGHVSVGFLKLIVGLILIVIEFNQPIQYGFEIGYYEDPAWYYFVADIVSLAYFIDYFLIGRATRRYNLRKIDQMMKQSDIWTKPEDR